MDKKEDKNKGQEFQISVNLDTTPIFYTDNINMVSNENGVVLDIMQRLGPTNQIRIVARIGMSREHAKKFVEELGKLLVMTQGSGQTGKDKLN
jgi:ABC-type Na+ transport system ATPase subunit NatA